LVEHIRQHLVFASTPFFFLGDAFIWLVHCFATNNKSSEEKLNLLFHGEQQESQFVYNVGVVHGEIILQNRKGCFVLKKKNGDSLSGLHKRRNLWRGKKNQLTWAPIKSCPCPKNCLP
jgi:hypothetical protein